MWMRKAVGLWTLLGLTVGASSALASTRCLSNHGTGYVDFDEGSGQAHVFMDGRYRWHLGHAVDLQLSCHQRLDSTREAWDCDEPRAGSYAHPDGRTHLGIEVSYEYYLMVATRDSRQYGDDMIVDDFTCYR